MMHFFTKLAGLCFLVMSVSFCSIDEPITQSSNSGVENQYMPDDENQNQNDSFESEDSSIYNETNNEPEEEPQILEFINSGVISKREINFIFSKSVKLNSISIEPEQEIKTANEGNIIKIHFKEDIITDIDFIIDLCVEDNSGNKLNLQSPFYIDNWNARLILNEVRTEYSGSTKRTEYIEFKVTKPGSIEGIKVFCESNEKTPMIYKFPAIDVRMDEYIVLHTRRIEDSCLDELGDNLDESGGKDSCPTARDLWIPGIIKLVRKNEVVYIRDINDNVLDAVMLTDGPNGWNNKSYLKMAAEFLLEQNAWHFTEGLVSGASDAADCSSVKTATTKSVSRDESKANTHSADDWYVTAAGGATPGLPNSKKP